MARNLPAGGPSSRASCADSAIRVSSTSARQGTRSTTRTPAFSTASTFSGLFDISRMAFSPKYCRIAPGQFVVAQVALKAELFVGFDRVGAVVLQLIGAEFVEQPDAAAFLVLVNQQAGAFLRDAFERDLELRAAIAAQAVEDVAREALRMDAHQRAPRPRRIPPSSAPRPPPSGSRWRPRNRRFETVRTAWEIPLRQLSFSRAERLSCSCCLRDYGEP